MPIGCAFFFRCWIAPFWNPISHHNGVRFFASDCYFIALFSCYRFASASSRRTASNSWICAITFFYYFAYYSAWFAGRSSGYATHWSVPIGGCNAYFPCTSPLLTRGFTNSSRTVSEAQTLLYGLNGSGSWDKQYGRGGCSSCLQAPLVKTRRRSEV